MDSVKAPDGYEGVMYFDDGARAWKAAYRAAGETFWTTCFRDAGHAHTVESERRERAEVAIIHTMQVRGLLPA